MFMGEHLHTVDDKGRIIIPAKFRDELGERFVVTKGLDKCLFVFPHSEWLNFQNKLKTLPISQPQAREFVRFFCAGAAECDIDKQGRVLLPGNLKQHARLEKDAVVVGVMNRVEIWSQSLWEAYLQGAEENSDERAQTMADLGI
ncbi:MAG: division/cell wall cluster transcriptional repressor MraZ [Gracilibacteraceae bacterium]|nr:division/cell wall cluster transcriptional repressor MraZ [Gracilibacteraceae bacterium]